ncbi:MAG: hypothetical protein KIT83_14210 [Bryobacterales bacterium]|nr:hypothetical protein [Bryobacterales bacterium]
MLMFHGIPAFAVAVVRLALVPVLGLLLPVSIHGQSALPASDLFQGEVPFRAIAYDLPDGGWPNTLSPLCMLARDLPLIAETGATAVYTRGAPPVDGDHVFLSLLASTRMSWVAAYPLPEEVDRSRSLVSQKAQILARFASFAERFSGNRSLRAVVLDFGKEHLEESAAMAHEFAAILQRYFPQGAPRLGHVAYTTARLDVVPQGVTFWIYRFEDSLPTNITRLNLRQRTTLPIVFDLSEVAPQLVPPDSAPPGMVQPSWKDYLALFRGGDSKQPLLTLRFMGKREISTTTTTVANNGVSTTTVSLRYRRDGLFVGLRDTALLENLQPTLFSVQQRDDWNAKPLEDHAAAPAVSRVLNAATSAPQVSPGTQVILEGELFQTKGVPTGDPEWPLHLGARCVCVAGRPIPLRSFGPRESLGQLPWLLDTGPAELRVVREGIASAPVTLDLLPFSPGVFADDLSRSGDGKVGGCNVSSGNGMKPGETLDLRVTGVGPLNGGVAGLRVLLDGTETQILSAGLVTNEPGIARIAVKIPPQGPAVNKQGLFVQRGAQASNLLPVSYAGDARPTVGLVASAAGIQVQTGALSAPLHIQTEGLNGYCGPVDFEVLGLPQGVTALISRVEAGKEATLLLRADGTATPAGKQKFYLYGVPLQGDLQLLTLELTVLPRTSSVLLALSSAGYSAGAVAAMHWGGELLAGSGIDGDRGLLLLVLNPTLGLVPPVERYDVYDTTSESARLEARLAALPAGTIVAMAIADDATLSMQPSLRSLIQTKLASTAIAGLAYQNAWAIIGKIGAAQPMAEAASPNQKVSIQATLQFGPP